MGTERQRRRKAAFCREIGRHAGATKVVTRLVHEVKVKDGGAAKALLAKEFVPRKRVDRYVSKSGELVEMGTLATSSEEWRDGVVGSISSKLVKELEEKGVIHIPSGPYARKLVNHLRPQAPVDADEDSRSKTVDGRIQSIVPHALSTMMPILVSFLVVLMPMFQHVDFNPEVDFRIAFKFLTLIASSWTQYWHQDYTGWRRGLVGILFLDDGVDTTQFKITSHRPGYVCKDDDTDVVMFNAKKGDVIFFHPNLVHRGMESPTGKTRRAVYFSVSHEARSRKPKGGLQQALQCEGADKLSWSTSYDQLAESIGLRPRTRKWVKDTRPR